MTGGQSKTNKQIKKSFTDVRLQGMPRSFCVSGLLRNADVQNESRCHLSYQVRWQQRTTRRHVVYEACWGDGQWSV